MPIRIPDPVPGAVELVRSSLSPLVALPEFRERVGLTGPLDALGLSMAAPHHVFTVSLDDAASGDLEGARPDVHRVVALAGDHVLGVVDLALDPQGQPAELRSVSNGPAIESLARVIRSLESLDAVAQGSYELRELQINELNLSAVWLKGEDGQDDVVIPVRGFAPFVPGQAMDGASFFEQVRVQREELLARSRGREV